MPVHKGVNRCQHIGIKVRRADYKQRNFGMQLGVGLGQHNRYKSRILQPRQYILIFAFRTSVGKRNIDGTVGAPPLRILIHLGNKACNIGFKGVNIGKERNHPAFSAVFAEQTGIEVLQYLRIIAVSLNLPGGNADLL